MLSLSGKQNSAEQVGCLFLADTFFEHIGGRTAVLQQTFYIDAGFLPFWFGLAASSA